MGADRLGGNMFKLVRRAALGLALSLGIAAPVVLVAAPAYATTTVTAIQLSDSTPVYGQETVATATVTSAGLPVTEGSVQFLVKDPAGVLTKLGASVPLNGAGQAVSVPVTQQDGTPMDVIDLSEFYLVRARYQPSSAAFDMSTGDVKISPVEKSGSTIGIQPGPTTIVADVSGALPGGLQQGSLKPSGTIAFSVNGVDVGSANLDASGQASIGFKLPNGAPQTVMATYGGDDNFEGSTHTLIRSDPVIEARLLSRVPRTSSGWYRTAVQVRFKCDPAGSELVVDCPEDATLRRSGRNQSLTRTIVAVDGGIASITVSGIDIDRQAPGITVGDGTCRATDRLSGVKHNRCLMSVSDNGTYVATAVDRAGNHAVKRGHL